MGGVGLFAWACQLFPAIVLILLSSLTVRAVGQQEGTLVWRMSSVSGDISCTIPTVYLPNGKIDNQPEKITSGASAEASNPRSTPIDWQFSEHDTNSSWASGEHPPGSPTPQQTVFSQRRADSHFLLRVNGYLFRVDTQQLNPEKRGSEDPSGIGALSESTEGLILPLNEMEEACGTPVIEQLAGIGADTLDYLVRYGTEETKWLLQDFYPVTVVALSRQELVVDRGAVISESELTCPVCQEGILRQSSLVKADCGDLLHAVCLMNYLHQSEVEDSNLLCPICRQTISVLGRLLGDDSALEQTLHDASYRGNSELVTVLLALGVNVDALIRGQTALHRAAKAGQYDVVRLLTRHGAIPDRISEEGFTPMQMATGKGFLSVADILAEALKTPGIFYVVGHGKSELLEEWLDRGGAPDVVRPADGLTLLHLATKNDHPLLVGMLLNAAGSLGLDIIETADTYGRTPLHYACDYGFSDTATVLLNHHANSSQPDLSGKTPLMLATERDYPDIVRLLRSDHSTADSENPSENGRVNSLLSGGTEHGPESESGSERTSVVHLSSPGSNSTGFYTLKIAQTTFLVPRKGVGCKLADSVVYWLDVQCQDCGSVVWFSLSRHANGHCVACSRCQQFIPPEGTLSERQDALRLHRQMCTGQRAGIATPYNPTVTAKEYSNLALFFRFSSPETIHLLLSESDSESVITALKKRGYLGQQPLHVLFAHGSSKSANDFLLHQHTLLHSNPDLLRMQQRDGWSPLHMLFYKGDEQTVRLFVDRYSDLLMDNPLMLQYCTTDGWTALHTLLRYQSSEVVQYFLEQNRELFERYPVILEKETSQHWNTLHILFFYGKPATASAFVDLFSGLLERHPQLLEKQNKNGDTPVNLLLSKGSIKSAALFFHHYRQWLVRQPQLLLQSNRQGQTLLHNFCLKAAPELIRQLFNESSELITIDALTGRADYSWTVLDCLFQRASPKVLSSWLQEHLGNGVQPLPESMIIGLLKHTQSWQVFVGYILSIRILRTHPLLETITTASRMLNPLPGGVMFDGSSRVCPITGDTIKVPVITNPCGHEFEQEALQRWMERPAARIPRGQFRCPRCGRAFFSYIRSYPDD